MLSFGRFFLTFLGLLVLPFGLKSQCSPDIVPPNAICQNVIVILDSNGIAPLQASQVDGGSFDNCILNSVSVNVDTLRCNQIGLTSVRLYAVDNSGNTDSCDASVTVLDSILPTARCKNDTVQLNPNRTYAPGIVDVEDGSYDNCGFTSQLFPSNVLSCTDLGPHFYTYVVEDAAGNLDSCFATLTLVDTLGYAALPVSLGNDTSICSGDFLFLEADSGYTSYQWSTGANTRNIVVGNTGAFSVVVSDSAGCSGTDTVLVSVDTVAPANIRPVETPFLCLNDTLDILSDPGFNSYQWSTGDNSQNIEITQGGWYYLTVSDLLGCEGQDSLFITQINQPGPSPVVSPGPTGTLCDGDTLFLDAGPGYFAYRWSNGSTSRFLPVLQPGIYNVVTFNGFGCWGASSDVTVSTRMAPMPTISMSGDSLVTDNWAAYQWYLNGNVINGAVDQFWIPQNNGIYRVEVEDLVGCRGSSDTLWVLTSLEENLDSQLSVYPNPSQGRIFVSWQNEVPHATEIRLLNSLGQEVFQQSFSPRGRIEVQLPDHLAEGMYWVEISSFGHGILRSLLLQP